MNAAINTHSSIQLKPLSDARLAQLVPSIFTEEASPDRSERYRHLPTIDVLHDLKKAGFLPVQAFQSAVHKSKKGKIEDRVPFAKHLIRLRERKYIDRELKISDMVPDVILTNSHDGTSAFRLEAGLFRLVCLNGLVVSSGSFGSVRVTHAGDIGAKVAEAAGHIAAFAPELGRVAKEWDKIELTSRQRNKFAKDAMEMRFVSESPLTIEQALTARRNEDEAPTLWRTYNVIQENLLKGGQQGKAASGRATSVREVTSVNNSLRYNRKLWELAEALAQRAP